MHAPQSCNSTRFQLDGLSDGIENREHARLGLDINLRRACSLGFSCVSPLLNPSTSEFYWHDWSLISSHLPHCQRMGAWVFGVLYRYKIGRRNLEHPMQNSACLYEYCAQWETCTEESRGDQWLRFFCLTTEFHILTAKEMSITHGLVVFSFFDNRFLIRIHSSLGILRLKSRVTKWLGHSTI